MALQFLLDLLARVTTHLTLLFTALFTSFFTSLFKPALALIDSVFDFVASLRGLARDFISFVFRCVSFVLASVSLARDCVRALRLFVSETVTSLVALLNSTIYIGETLVTSVIETIRIVKKIVLGFVVSFLEFLRSVKRSILDWATFIVGSVRSARQFSLDAVAFTQLFVFSCYIYTLDWLYSVKYSVELFIRTSLVFFPLCFFYALDSLQAFFSDSLAYVASFSRDLVFPLRAYARPLKLYALGLVNSLRDSVTRASTSITAAKISVSTRIARIKASFTGAVDSIHGRFSKSVTTLKTWASSVRDSVSLFKTRAFTSVTAARTSATTRIASAKAAFTGAVDSAKTRVTTARTSTSDRITTVKSACTDSVAVARSFVSDTTLPFFQSLLVIPAFLLSAFCIFIARITLGLFHSAIFYSTVEGFRSILAILRAMEPKTERLLERLRDANASLDAKVDSLLAVKADIKQNNVPVGAVQGLFDAIKIGISSNYTRFCGAAFSTAGNLTKRLFSQQQQHLVATYARILYPVLLERLGDQKERIRNHASQAFVDFWPAAQDEVQEIVLVTALKGKNPRAKQMATSWLLIMVNKYGIAFRRYLSDVCGCLEDADLSVRETAKSVLVELFINQDNESKLYLKRTMERRVDLPRKATRDWILSQIGPIEDPEEPSFSQGMTEHRDLLVVRRDIRRAEEENALALQEQKVAMLEQQLEKNQAPLEDLRKRANFGEKLDVEVLQQDVPRSKTPLPSLPPFKPVAQSNAPKVQPFFVRSADQLEDIFREMAPYFEGRESEENWSQREKSVITLRRMIGGNAPQDYPQIVHASFKIHLDGIFKTVLSLRTTVSSNGLYLVTDMARLLGPGIDNMVEIIIQNLLKVCVVSKKIASQNANNAVDAVMANVSYKERLLQHIHSSTSDRNVNLRLFAAGWLRTIINRHPSIKAAIEHGNGLNLITASIKIGLKDANPRVKDEMRHTYWTFYVVWPAKAESIASDLDPKSKSLLDKSAHNPKTRVAGTSTTENNPVAAAPEAGRPTLRSVIAAQKRVHLKGKAPEVLQDKAPEVPQDRAPEVLKDKAPEVLKDKAPEVLKDKAPEVLKDRAPEESPALAGPSTLHLAPVRPRRFKLRGQQEKMNETGYAQSVMTDNDDRSCDNDGGISETQRGKMPMRDVSGITHASETSRASEATQGSASTCLENMVVFDPCRIARLSEEPDLARTPFQSGKPYTRCVQTGKPERVASSEIGHRQASQMARVCSSWSSVDGSRVTSNEIDSLPSSEAAHVPSNDMSSMRSGSGGSISIAQTDPGTPPFNLDDYFDDSLLSENFVWKDDNGNWLYDASPSPDQIEQLQQAVPNVRRSSLRVPSSNGEWPQAMPRVRRVSFRVPSPDEDPRWQRALLERTDEDSNRRVSTPSSQDSNRSQHLLDRGIQLIRSNRMDPHGFRKLRSVMGSATATLSEGQHNELADALLGALVRGHGTGGADTSLLPLLDVLEHTLFLCNGAFLHHTSTGGARLYYQTISSFLETRGRCDASGYFAVRLDEIASRIVSTELDQGTFDSIQAILDAISDKKEEKNVITMGLMLLAGALHRRNASGLGLPESIVQGIGSLVAGRLEDGHAEVRRLAIQSCVHLKALIGDEEKFWSFFGTPSTGTRNLLAYYLARG
ncbi:hypothetical protein P170DRAFT_485239 [Aspergillus steynii IBT 23096]|uniref:TOG domain-containing protein n=1 Tax=Aspergillus steynii IBT 23096 TaxID=1392250 RepID=A0A2I2FSH9_9EURO|nr:uncharacterized protein P170DRAFT_485239 [Aspergillus steynii IBT 23096]PLB43590.1 hypothetical protein P170DRAFT_485239 [Aspergillus steynii IBT 23096]